MAIITNTNPGNFLTDGVFVNQIPAPPPSPVGPQTGLVGVVGCANWGPVNSAQYYGTAASCVSTFGNGTAMANSLVLGSLVAMPECQQFVGVRVTNGTDTSATIAIPDGGSGTVFTLIAKNTGSLPNPATGTAASAQLVFTSGTISGGTPPVYSLSIYFPGYATETFTGISGGATVFNSTTFLANVLAAVNGQVANKQGSLRWTAMAGTSTSAPSTARQYASGGTDGAVAFTGSTTVTGTGYPMLGTNAVVPGTGIYALSGLLSAGQLMLPGFTDPSVGATLASFATTENCFALLSFPTSTATATETSTQSTNNLINDSLFLASDWDYYYDTITGVNRLCSPESKIAGIIASLPAYLYPGNKPYTGATGIISTDRTSNPVTVSEAGLRESAGILYLSNNPNLFARATGYGLPHGLTSSGKLISDVRMLKYISVLVQQALAQVVGEMQSAAPNDPLRAKAKDLLDKIFQPLLTSTPAQIAAYQDVTDTTLNSATTVAQGFLISSTSVTTLSAARFVVNSLAVGSTVQIITSTATGS